MRQLFETTKSLRPLRARQTRAIEEIRNAVREGHRRIVLQAPTGFGKCLGKGTPVLMLDGTIKPVESIITGDLLMGPDSKPRRVKSTTRGIGPLFRVIPVKGDSYVCNDVHILSLKRTKLQSRGEKVRSDCKDGGIVNIPLNEYLHQSKTFKHIHKAWRTGVRFETMHVPFDPYFLGVWLGDGNSDGLGITTQDAEIKELCARVAGQYGLKIRISDGTEENPRCPTYYLACEKGQRNPLWSRFKDLDLHKGKHIPLLYKANSAYVRRSVLAGLIDTDGYMIPRGGCDLVFKNRTLAEDTCFLARSLGLAAYMKECSKTCVNNGQEGTYYRILISGDLTQLPMRIPRKAALAWKQKKNVLVTGISVEPLGEGEYYGFEIDGDRLFMLGDFTVTHNTLLSAHMISSAAARGNRPLFTCPAITLVNQTLKAFENEGISDIGVIQAQHERTDFMAQVQIASVQTLIRRELPEVHLVLIDEVHIQYKALNAVLDSEEWKDKIVVGLSATPWTKGMGLRWTKLIIAATIQELIDEKLLSPFVIYAPKHEADLSHVKISKGEYEEESLSKVMSDNALVADVVKTWIDKGPGDRTFLFAVNRAHARKLQEEFTEAGVSCGYIDAFTDGDDRKIVFEKFRAAEYKVIASVGCLTTGVDEDVRCIIDAQPTRDEKKHVQKIGRGLRTAPGKFAVLILDHAGNTLRLGMVTDIHHDHLDTRKPGEKGDAYEGDPPPPKPRKCKNCGAVIPAGKPACGFCHHKVELEHGVEVAEGELVEFKATSKKQQTLQDFLDFKGLKMHVHYGFENMEQVARDHGYTGKQTDYLNQQDWYSGLLGLAQEHGYKTRWADERFRSKFGDFPVRLRKEPKTPSIAIRAFDHHQRIKWAKGREKQNA